MLNKIKFILNSIINIPNKIILFWGFLIVIYIIWIRFLLIRLPRSILDEPTDIRVFILVALCVFYIIFIVYSVRQIFNIQPKSNSVIHKMILQISKNKYYQKLDILFKRNIVDSPAAFYVFIHKFLYDKINIRDVIISSGMFIYNYLLKSIPKYTYYIYISWLVIPRVLISIIFLIDVFWFNFINHFYKSIILMIIPLCFQFYLFVIEHLFFDCRKFFHSILIITPLKDFPDSFHIEFRKKENMPEDHGGFADYPTKDNLDYLANEINKWNKISAIFYSYNNIIKDWKYHLYIITFTNYLIGWSYYLYISFYSEYIKIITIGYKIIIIIILLLVTMISKIIIHDYYNKNQEDKEIYFKLYIYSLLYIISLLLYIYLPIKIIIIVTIVVYNIYRLFTSIITIAFLENMKNKIRKYTLKFSAWIYEKIYIRSMVICNIQFILKYVNNKYKLLYLFHMVPRVLVVSIFIFDIIYKIDLTYFYRSLFLLLLPIIFKIYLFVIYYLSVENIKHINNYVDISYEKDQLILTFKPDTEGDYNDINNNYRLFVSIIDLIDKLNIYIEKNKRYLDVIISITYIVGWIYQISNVW